MTVVDTIGWLGGICLSICGVPQAWACYKSGNAKGLDHGFIWLWFMGEALTFAYVWAQKELLLPLVFNYALNLVTLLAIMRYKYFPRGKA